MIQKWPHPLTTVLVLAIIGVCTFWWISPWQATNVSKATRTEKSSFSQGESDEPPVVSNSRAQRVTAMTKSLFTPEQLATPELQKFLTVMESSAFENFLENNPNGLDFLEFFADQGIPVDLEIFTKHYLTFFPTNEPAALEPEMRRKLYKMFIAAELNPENPQDIHRVENLLQDFLADEQNTAWMMGHFQGDYEALGEWVVEVLQSSPSESSVVEPAFIENETTPVSESPTRAEFLLLPSLSGTADTVHQPPHEPLEGGTTEEVTEHTTISRTKPEVDTEPPEHLSDEMIETTLRERFSPERFNRAMQTLTQYGLKDGLRRLQVSDPACAEQIERLFRKQEED